MLKRHFLHIDGSQIKKLAWLLYEMCEEWSNVSFKQLKLDLELENWLKIEKIEIWGHAATTFERQNLKIGNFSWKRVALRWKSARNTSFRCWNRTVKIGRSQNNAIWKSHNFAKNWPKMVEKWVKMIFLDHGVNRKVVDNDKNYLNMKFQPKVMKRSREKGQKPHFSKNCL